MVLGIAAAACVAAATALLVRMHLLPTGLDPVEDAVSDYGTTRFHGHYRTMVILLGAGAVLLAIGLERSTDAGGSLFWLWLYGASRIAIAGFMIDADRPPTVEGRIHLLLAGVSFVAIALAATNITWTGAPGALRPLGYAVAASAVATIVTHSLPATRRVFGFVERLFYLTSIAWLLLASIDLAANA